MLYLHINILTLTSDQGAVGTLSTTFTYASVPVQCAWSTNEDVWFLLCRAQSTIFKLPWCPFIYLNSLVLILLCS